MVRNSLAWSVFATTRAWVPELTRPIPDWRGSLTITKLSPSSYRLCSVHVHVQTCNERTLCQETVNCGVQTDIIMLGLHGRCHKVMFQAVLEVGIPC